MPVEKRHVHRTLVAGHAEAAHVVVEVVLAGEGGRWGVGFAGPPADPEAVADDGHAAGEAGSVRDLVNVAGVSYRVDALQDDGFAPGRRLALVPEPENEHDPNAVGVWDERRHVQAGYLPAEVAHDFPGGEWRRIQRARGYRYVVVNGGVTIENDRETDVHAGRLLRHGAM